MRTDLTIAEVFPAGVAAFGAAPVPPLVDGTAAVRSSRTSRPRVLCFSRARTLGETRHAVLQRWFEAVLVHSLEEVSRLAAAPPFDAVVLCHTSTPDERAQLLAMVRSAWPLAKIVFVTAQGEVSEGNCDRMVPGLAGPEALLAAVRQVLRPAVSFAAEFNPS